MHRLIQLSKRPRHGTPQSTKALFIHCRISVYSSQANSGASLDLQSSKQLLMSAIYATDPVFDPLQSHQRLCLHAIYLAPIQVANCLFHHALASAYQSTVPRRTEISSLVSAALPRADGAKIKPGRRTVSMQRSFSLPSGLGCFCMLPRNMQLNRQYC